MELSQTTQSVLKKHLGESMRDYRTAKGLTQEILIQKMGSVGVHYDRSKVSNWERAKERPKDDHIRAFGKVLDLPPSVVESLIERAGLAWRKRISPKREASLPEKFGQPGATDVEAGANKGPFTSYAGNVVGQILSRFVLPGLAVAAPGVVLAAFGWNAAWVLALYACLAIGLVLGQAFLRLRRSNDLRELLFASLFFLLSTPLLQFPLTRMDHYGLYALGDLAGTPVPLLLALLVNLVIALAAAMMFDHLWRWQYADASDERRAYARSGWVVLPPLAFVYCTQVLFSNVGGWIYFLILMTVLAGVFTALVVLRDDHVRAAGWSGPSLLWPTVAVIIVLLVLGAAGILVGYLDTSVLAVPDHNLFRSWAVDFGALGYPEAELMERLRIGFLWGSLTSLTYMLIVIGGHLLAAILSLRVRDPRESGVGDDAAFPQAGPAGTRG